MFSEDVEQLLKFLREPPAPTGMRYNFIRIYVNNFAIKVEDLGGTSLVVLLPAECMPFIKYLEKQIDLYREYLKSLEDVVYLQTDRDGSLIVLPKNKSIVFRNKRGFYSYEKLTRRLEKLFNRSDRHEITLH